MSQRRAFFLSVAVATTVALAAGCGGGSNSNAFSQCGNGRIDSGERCDDGNLDDTDACTSACQPARCGDGVVQAGVEQCDGLNLNRSDCSTFGLSGTGLHCNSSCQYDTSLCGAPFTPSPTPTETSPPPATNTPGGTNTPTATPTPNACGDGFLEPPETCDSCPMDCQILACTPGLPMQLFAVDFTVPAGSIATAVSALVGYQSNRVSLPATGAGTRVKNRPPSTSQLVNNLGYAVRVLINAQAGSDIPSGQLFTINFDSCDGAPSVGPANFGCTVESCGSSFGPIAGCTCVVAAAAATP